MQVCILLQFYVEAYKKMLFDAFLVYQNWFFDQLNISAFLSSKTFCCGVVEKFLNLK
jgi:hypothetical protein